MLVRAARRHGRHRVLNVAYRQLQLPWLCPTHAQYSLSRSRLFTVGAGTDSAASPRRKRRNSQDVTTSQAQRSLATAVDIRPFNDSIPFENISQRQLPPSIDSRDAGLNDGILRASFDPTATLVLKEHLTDTPYRIRNYRGVGGDPEDILSILDACLQVGAITRARVIMERLINLRFLSPDDLMELHNSYLKASLKYIIERPSDVAAQEMHKWFELEIKNKGLPMTAETITHMLRASLQSPRGSRQDRLLRRYMDMGGLQVLPLLTAEELAHITTVVPDFNYQAEDADQSQDIELLDSKTGEADPVIDAASDAASNVRSVTMHGLGLKSLQQSLSLFANKPADFNPDALNADQRRQRQAQLEIDSVRSAIDRWREENAQLTKRGVDTTLETKSLGSRMWKWHGSLEAYFRDELKKIELAEAKTSDRSTLDNDRCLYGPLIRLVPAERLAAVTILNVMSSLGGLGAAKGLPLAQAVITLGEALEAECLSEAIVRSRGKNALHKFRLGQSGAATRMLKSRERAVLQKPASECGPHTGTTGQYSRKLEDIVDPHWSQSIRGKVGAFMLSSLIEVAKVPVKKFHQETGEEMVQTQPAFSHGFQYKQGRKIGVIFPNHALIEQLRREPVHSLLAKHLPMVAEPDPWTKFNSGGFIIHPAKVMRIKSGDKDQRNYAEASIRSGDMNLMFKGLDVLGKTAWKVNREVFDVMLEAWNSGDAVANIAPVDPDLGFPPEPELSEDPAVRRAWLKAIKAVENVRSGFHSQRCFQNFQLEIARALKDETFYLPHNVDFRGRAYPIPPYFNHMGADHCRGLLTFANGRKLGADGLRWLKIHLANVYGFDKASLKDRESFADENVDKIYDSAANPLTGEKWWLSAEDPWQCLAACFEVRNALNSGDPCQFRSHLPVHQDGTCNGLQHYAALGGDEWGAKQVNLVPGDRPADVYTAVAKLVQEAVARDAAKGNEYAKFLDGKITRKVVKQTVMTNVYGVTFIGAKAQVRKQLEAAHPDLPNSGSLHTGFLSSYIASEIFSALSTMFSGAHHIQHWLGECATRISRLVAPEQLDAAMNQLLLNNDDSAKIRGKSGPVLLSVEEQLQFKCSVTWTNPLRMPIVQPYRTPKVSAITTNLQKVTISNPHRSDPVNKRKQLQSFPPNFIHSLDATHMILSALACDRKGLTFAAVHDSFWTHAADISEMNEALRDAFVQIHSEDVIGRLSSEFEARYTGGLCLARIKPKTPLALKIREARRNLSASKDAWLKKAFQGPEYQTTQRARGRELLLEWRRLQLLRSSDPEEVQQGQEMITPGSIYEQMAVDDDLQPVESPENSLLGRAPTEEVAFPGDGTRLSSMQDSDGSMEDPESTVPSDPYVASEHVNPLTASVLGQKFRQTDKPEWAWVPFQVPSVPKKGTFDVAQLKQSDYFFS